MNFAHVDSRLTFQKVRLAQEKFDWLLVELGVREDNSHVGTGLGGNNLQLVTLMGFAHNLVKRPIDVRVDDKRMTWGVDWFLSASKKQVRARLDQVFETIDEQHKYLAAALTDLTKPNMMAIPTAEHKQRFPQLIKALESKNYRLNPALTMVEQLVLACVMCHELSLRLDKGDTSLVSSVGKALYDFPYEIILLSVRKYVGIERLIRFDLDEYPAWAKTLDSINRIVCDA
jgi:hypothetical protein